MSSNRLIHRLLPPLLATAVAASLGALAVPAGAADSGAKRPDIVGGSASSTTKFPWQVRLEIQTAQGTGLCGGAIIHSRIVLTAAHCLEGATAATAYFGRDLASSGGVAASAAAPFTTPGYNPGTTDNDYGLLFFSTPIPSAFRPIQIAGPSESTLWRAGRTATVAGFGNLSEGGSTSPVLQEVSMPIQPDSTCAAPGVYGTQFRVSSMLCVGSTAGGQSTCQGDSGGPLVVPGDNGVWRIAGLVSWAKGCARPGFPTVFTRIADPAMSARLVDEITQIRNDNPGYFPGAESAINILGSGAVPPGCSAANAAAVGAAAAVTTAQGALAQATTSVQKAAKKRESAAAKLKKLKKHHAAKKKIAKAKKAKQRAKTKVEKAEEQAGSAQTALSSAQAGSGNAAAAATAACS